MSKDIELKTFPNSRTTALTMLYLQKQDLSGVTPEELVDKYDETYERIRKRFNENRSKTSSSWLK